MQNDFNNHINKSFSFLKESKILVAISGGIDSVVLAHLCKANNLNFALAHCNFKLRGKDSDADEIFVRQLAKQLDISLFVKEFNTEAYSKTQKTSIQVAARELRYNWFNTLLNIHKLEYILTAHHLDDNFETFLINLSRGTGLSGLTGIPEHNKNIVRPLLPFSRKQIEVYAKKHNIIWREDASNASNKYLRNAIRHDVMPILKALNPQLLSNFGNTIDHLKDTASIVAQSIADFKKYAISEVNEDCITYKVSEFQKLENPKAYLFEIFKNYGFTAWNDVLALLNAETGKYVVSKTHRLEKHREFLMLSALNQPKKEIYEFALKSFEDFETPNFTICFKEVSTFLKTNNQTIFVDKSKLQLPLTLRKWTLEDSFKPLGMTGKKKLSKFLKDQKITPHQKENTWLLLSNNTVLWVVGQRADDRFKVTKTTNAILQITVTE